jgi:hypothetical protein
MKHAAIFKKLISMDAVCRRIVEYSHYCRLKLLFETDLILLHLVEITGKLVGPG